MIKKFQNPSGKLTYEKALEQAGKRVENQMKPSIQVKGVNNSNRKSRIRNRENPDVVIIGNRKKSKKVYNPDNGVIAKAKRKALNAIGISNSDIKRMQSDLVELGILPDGGSNGTNYGVVMPGILDGAPNIKITKANASKITPKQWTAAQDAAIARGDMAEAQRLRDLHFKTKAPKNKLIDENGNPVAVKHHGNVWNVFDPDRTMSGTLWTANEDAFKLCDIKTFPASDLPTEWKNLYINMKNPIQDEVSIGTTKMLSEIRKGSKDAIKESIRDYGISNPDGVFNRVKITENSLKKNGYDLNDPEIQEILNNPEFYGKEPTMAATAYPNNIKLADAVTYNDNGVRIPLGERDNFNINDIRYGLLPFGIGLTGYGLYNLFNQPQQQSQYYKQGGKMNTIQFLQGGNKIRKGEDGLKNFLGNSTNNSLGTRNVSDHNLGRLYDELSKSKIPMNHTTREQFITRSKDVINAINKHFSGPEIPRVFRNALLTVALEETGLNPSNQYLYGIIGGLRNLYQQKFGGRKDSDSITHFIKKYFKGEYKNLGYSPKAIPSNVTDPREILTYYMTNLGDPSFFKRKNKGNTVAWKKWNEWLPIILNSNLIAQNDSNFENNKNQFNTFNNESENNLNNVFNNESENDSYNIIDPNDQLKKLNKQSGNVMLSKNGNKLIALIPKGKTGIHIKKKNRGKFTDYCGGKVTDSCIRRAKASGNPTLVKRATFAANARKWKH